MKFTLYAASLVVAANAAYSQADDELFQEYLAAQIMENHLSEEQVQVLIQHFDRDNSGTVNFDEFLRALRGELNENRTGYIRQAYDKLDINKDGQVTLDDIARIYDVSQHPDVIDGKKTPEEAYREFMSMWDTQVADGIVTFEEFCDYYKDVSASIDTDEYFAFMMTQAWKL